MKVTMVDSNTCSGGSCPTVYKTDRGTFLVQGYVIKPSELDDLPAGIPQTETIVEVPAEWFLSAARKAGA
jgi:hypothetical protein